MSIWTTLGAFTIAAILMGFALTRDWTCKPGDPSIKIGNMVVAGCQ